MPNHVSTIKALPIKVKSKGDANVKPIQPQKDRSDSSSSGGCTPKHTPNIGKVQRWKIIV